MFQAVAEGGSGGQKNGNRPDRGADHRADGAHHQTEQKATGNGQHGTAGQGQGNRDGVESHIDGNGEYLVLAHELGQFLTVFRQRLEGQIFMGAGQIDNGNGNDDQPEGEQPLPEGFRCMGSCHVRCHCFCRLVTVIDHTGWA